MRNTRICHTTLKAGSSKRELIGRSSNLHGGWRGLTEALLEPLLHTRPFAGEDRITHRIPWREIGSHPMSPQDSFEPSADSLQCGARWLVAFIGVETNTQHDPYFEGVAKHHELSLRVGGRANRRTREPCVTYLAGIRSQSSMRRMTLRPLPAFDVPKPGRTNDLVAGCKDDCEGNGRPGVPPSKGCVDVLADFLAALRNRTPRIQRGVCSGSGNQTITMAPAEGFQGYIVAFDCWKGVHRMFSSRRRSSRWASPDW